MTVPLTEPMVIDPADFAGPDGIWRTHLSVIFPVTLDTGMTIPVRRAEDTGATGQAYVLFADPMTDTLNLTLTEVPS